MIRPNAEPNVTPLIDVMLVLLILFMVITPLTHRSLDVEVPTPAVKAGPPETGLVVHVGVSVFRLGSAQFASAADLEDELRNRLAVRSDRTVVVRTAEPVTYGRVVSALDAIEGAGAERIGVVTRDELAPQPTSEASRTP